MFLGNYTQALGYYDQSLSLYEKLGDQKRIASLLNNFGAVYGEQRNHPRALDYYLRSLHIREEIGDSLGVAMSLNNIGNVYIDQNDFVKSLEYHSECLRFRKKIGDKRGIAGSLGNIGIVYKNKGDYAKALDFSEQSLKLYIEVGDLRGVAMTLNTSGAVFQHQGNLPKALEYFTRSLKLEEEFGNKNGIAKSLTNIGSVYNEMGKYGEAIANCEAALVQSKDMGLLDVQLFACQCLYQSNKARGDSEEALRYIELMRVAEDSLDVQETSSQLQQMEFAKTMLLDSIAKAEEARLIQEVHQEEVREKNMMLRYFAGGGLLMLILAGAFFNRWVYVRKSRDIIAKERNRSESLLLNILPADVAQELKEKGRADARDFELVSILFTDFKGFTEHSAKLTATELVSEINHCFEAFDGFMEAHGIEKIKTIGDAYMAAGGLPAHHEGSVKNTVLAALEMQEFIGKRKNDMDALGKTAFEMRVGIHTGPVVAGIVGVKKFQYDLWGDTVNTASRMESACEAGKVNISQSTYEQLKDDPQFSFKSRGKIFVKGKGEMEMYFVDLME
jgi:class 3 adenylate cyclase/tetratricopeptide (TPR) repeat protein